MYQNVKGRVHFKKRGTSLKWGAWRQMLLCGVFEVAEFISDGLKIVPTFLGADLVQKVREIVQKEANGNKFRSDFRGR